MNRRSIAAALALLLGIGISGCSRQAETVPGKQTTCPVMKGKAVNPNLYVDAAGKRIYVCCPGCIATVKADPEKYIGEMEAEGIILEEVPPAE